MALARVGLLGATLAAAAILASGCGTEPSSTVPPAVVPPADKVAPTAPVNANGEPIANLCDLLTEADVSRILGVEAKAPADGGASPTDATCAYGDAMTLTVKVLATTDEASASLKQAVKDGPFDKKKDGVQAGVDESVYGSNSEAYAIAVRRAKLVISIVASGSAKDGEPKLIQLAGLVLNRVNALGT